MDFENKARHVKLLVLDCDGVLTDGRLYFGPTGEELKVFHVRDGQGLITWHQAGFRSAIISGRNSTIVEMRAKQLGIEFIFQGREDKISALKDLLTAANVTPEEAAFVGDDTPDMETFSMVGFSVAVGDAHKAAKDAADYITEAKGGRGAVREVIDLLLYAKSKTRS